MGTRRTRDVLVERATRDVDETLVHLRERLRADASGPMRALETAVFSLVGLLNPRGRIAKDIDHLLDVAQRIEAGEDPRKVAREMLHDTLRLWEINLVVRVKDPLFQHILDVSERIYADRLPDFARMGAVPDATDYPDLVRRAFPDRAHADRIVDENGNEVLRIIDLAHAHPQLVRLPRAWTLKLTGIARDMVTWKIEQVRHELDEIYSGA